MIPRKPTLSPIRIKVNSILNKFELFQDYTKNNLETSSEIACYKRRQVSKAKLTSAVFTMKNLRINYEELQLFNVIPVEPYAFKGTENFLTMVKSNQTQKVEEFLKHAVAEFDETFAIYKEKAKEFSYKQLIGGARATAFRKYEITTDEVV